jgi:uncharacterized membrane protein YtjA (UPF0391 family)
VAICHSVTTVRVTSMKEQIDMFAWALGFLIIAVVASVFGFTGVASGAADIAKVVFAVALLVAVVGAAVAGARRRRSM